MCQCWCNEITEAVPAQSRRVEVFKPRKRPVDSHDQFSGVWSAQDLSSGYSVGGVVVESGIPTWGDGQLVRGCLVLRQPVVLGRVGDLSLGSLSREGIPPGGHRTCNP